MQVLSRAFIYTGDNQSSFCPKIKLTEAILMLYEMYDHAGLDQGRKVKSPISWFSVDVMYIYFSLLMS